MKRIEFEDGGVVAVNQKRGTLVLTEEFGGQACVVLDDGAAMELAAALTEWVADRVSPENALTLKAIRQLQGLIGSEKS